MSRARLRGAIKKQLDVDPYECPMVTLEEFFEGNEDLGSIGCNLAAHPGVSFFFDFLVNVRALPSVQDLRVAVTDVMDEPEWPFSDTVYVLTTATPGELDELFLPLQTELVGDPIAEAVWPKHMPRADDGYSLYAIWWD